jgi:AraC-like DNA-binding protein
LDEEPLSEGRFAIPEALENDLISLPAAQLVPAVRRGPEVNPFRVKSIALSPGYRLSGRFAAEFRSIHGGNPSDMLRASR